MKAQGIKLRRLMLLVALAAASIFATAMWRRSTEFSAAAKKYELDQMLDEAEADSIILQSMRLGSVRLPPELEAKHRFIIRCANFNKRLCDKYRRAARLPWLPVAPNPRPPVWDPSASR